MNSQEAAASPDRQERLRQLLRRRAGQEKREQLERLLGGCAPTGWTVVPPPDSDPVVANLFEAIRSAREGGRLQLEDGLTDADFRPAVDRALEAAPNDGPVILTLSAVSEIGIVETDLELVKSCALTILDHDRDSLIIANPQASWGLVCQRFEEAAGVTYQIESWR